MAEDELSMEFNEFRGTTGSSGLNLCIGKSMLGFAAELQVQRACRTIEIFASQTRSAWKSPPSKMIDGGGLFLHWVSAGFADTLNVRHPDLG